MSELFSANLLIPSFSIFIASFMQSITGFGLAIIATPLLLISYEPKLVVVMLQFIAICSNVIFTIYLFKKANKTMVLHLMKGSLIGQVLGLFIYDSVSNMTLKIFVSICILVFLILMKCFNAKIPENNRNSSIAGFFSGILATTTSMSGPPLVMYLAYTKQPPAVLRATCVLYFAITNLTSLLAFYLNGEPMLLAGTNAIALLPALLLGLFCGNLVFKHVSAEVFKQLIFAMLFISCIYTIYTLC